MDGDSVSRRFCVSVLCSVCVRVCMCVCVRSCTWWCTCTMDTLHHPYLGVSLYLLLPRLLVRGTCSPMLLPPLCRLFAGGDP